MSVDILGTSWDQCRSMVQYSLTSTETRRLVRMDSPGRPPRLSHSSWTIHVLDSSVQFKMVYIYMQLERPIICVPPRLSEVSPTLPFKHFRYWSDCRWPSLVLSRKIVERFLFARLSPPGDPGILAYCIVPNVTPQCRSHLEFSKSAK